MDKFESVDWFTDPAVHQDPNPYYDYLRAKGPAVLLPQHNVVAVTGYDEALKVFRDDLSFSAVNAVTGPFPPLPFKPEGEDITDQIEANRAKMAFDGLLMTMDRPVHLKHRALLMGLITPPRLKKNEQFIRRLADQQIGKILETGAFEAVTGLGHPLAVLVVADLLGIPESEHARILELVPPLVHATVGGQTSATVYNAFDGVGGALAEFIVDRRASPRADVLTDLARASFPDGTTPDINDLVTLAAFLFVAGQDTTVRLLSTSLQVLGDNPELHQTLRADHSRIPAFLEEMLRIESPSKVDFRLTRVRTRMGDIDVEAGTTVMIMIGAANRDPAKFDRPDKFIMDRPNVREQLAFGRGNHACPGAPLARSEVRIAIERLFDHTTDIRISEEKHGPRDARRYEYPARYTMRGLKELHMEVTPA